MARPSPPLRGCLAHFVGEAFASAGAMSDAPARVVFTTGFSRRYTGGVTEFAVAAKTLRGVIREMDKKFPGLAETLEEETTVAIDGELYEIDFLRPVKPGAEVFFIPKIEGG